MGRGRPFSEVSKGKAIKIINKQDRKDLKVLADDFGFCIGQMYGKLLRPVKALRKGNRRS